MAIPNLGRITKLFQKRSQFKTVPVQQISAALTEIQYKVTPKVEAVLEHNICGELQSELIEALNGIQKQKTEQAHALQWSGERHQAFLLPVC